MSGRSSADEAAGRSPTTGPHLSVVVPCFNEAEVLSELYRRVTTVCAALGESYEIVLVDDGSRDETWKRMAGLAASDPCVIAVALSRNHGHQLALRAGLTVCRGRRVLIMDGDLQDPPELLPEMLRLMDAGAEVVYGQRRSRPGETVIKRATAAGFYRILEGLTDVGIPRDTGDFRLISRKALDVLLTMPERRPFIRGMVSWIGFHQVPILYDRPARSSGRTKFSLRRMISFAFDGIASMSVRPLHLAAWAGLTVLLVSVGLGGVSLAGFARRAAAAPALGLVAVITFLAALQLITIGILGGYLGRLYEQGRGRPLFVIDRIVGGSEPGDAKGPARPG